VTDNDDYKIYKLDWTLTINELDRITATFTPIGTTLNITVNGQNNYVILQAWDEQYIITPNKDYIPDVLKIILISTQLYNEYDADQIASTAEEVTPDQIEGPYSYETPYKTIEEEFEEEINQYKQYYNLFQTAYDMLLTAEQTPFAKVLAVPKSYDILEEMASLVIQQSTVPDTVTTDVLAITPPPPQLDLNKTISAGEKELLILNTTYLINDITGESPQVLQADITRIEYNPNLSGIYFEYDNPIPLYVLEEEPQNTTTIVYAIDDQGNEYPAVVTTIVNNTIVTWNLIATGIQAGVGQNQPSYSNTRPQEKHVYNLVINIIPIIGFKPEFKVPKISLTQG